VLDGILHVREAEDAHIPGLVDKHNIFFTPFKTTLLFFFSQIYHSRLHVFVCCSVRYWQVSAHGVQPRFSPGSKALGGFTSDAGKPSPLIRDTAPRDSSHTINSQQLHPTVSPFNPRKRAGFCPVFPVCIDSHIRAQGFASCTANCSAKTAVRHSDANISTIIGQSTQHLPLLQAKLHIPATPCGGLGTHDTPPNHFVRDQTFGFYHRRIFEAKGAHPCVSQ
jgi:hypothetical protein